jgi:hypothetical protein
MNTGSITMFSPALAATSHIAVRVSPAARNDDRKTKKRNVNGIERKMTSMYATAAVKTPPSAPTSATSGRRIANPADASTRATATASRADWATAFSARRSLPAPTCWETTALVAAVSPTPTETNSQAVGNMSETAATASALTRPTQNMSARL